MAITLGEARLCRNELLSKLTDEQFQPILPKLEIVYSRIKDVLYEQDGAIRYIYFPCTAAYSNVVHLEDGNTVEVGTVGNEGFCAVEALLQGTNAIETAVCQIEGRALRMKIDDFREATYERTPLRHLLECYALGYLAQVSQTAACNRVHHINARFARWLLITHDRVQGDDFYLTQEFLAFMLGVHRPGVSGVASAFQDAGIIEYRRGHVKILNRAGLEAAACECYSRLRGRFRNLLGSSVRQSQDGSAL